MIWRIVAREFLDSLISLRFIISTVLCIFLITSVVYVSTDDYVDRLKDHDSAVAAHKEDRMREYSPKLFRKPQPLGVFSEGMDKRVGKVVEIRSWDSPFVASEYGWYGREAEYMASFASIDVAFVIRFILSLLAVFLTYDAIAGERESGLIKLVLSNPVSRSSFLVGKLLGRLLCVLIPLVLGAIIALLFFLANPSLHLSSVDWARIGIFFGVALIYVSLFLCLGLAVSAAVRSSASSLIILLTVWIMAVAVHPVLSVLTAEKAYSIDDPTTMGRKIYRIDQQYQERWNELLAKIREQDRKGSNRREYTAQFNTLNMEKAQMKDKISQEFLNAFTGQANLAKNLSRLSPAGSFSYAASAVVNTDISSYDSFMEISRQFWHRYVEHRKKWETVLREDPGKAREMKFPEAPEIQYSLADSIQRAAPDIAILILFTGLSFVASYALFVRRDLSM
ncbi:ABC transporter permease [Candidatus Poribacteria bacterium]